MAGKRPVGVAAHVSSVGSSAFFFAMVQSGKCGNLSFTDIMLANASANA